MKALFSTWAMTAFMIPATLCGLAGDYKTACVQGIGQALFEVQYCRYEADEFWNASGKKKDAHNEFKRDEYSLYIEAGLTAKDTVSVKGAWARIDESINGRTFGFEDVELGWKHSLGTKWNHLLATELVGIIPVERDHKPGLRYGQYGCELNLLLTRGLTLFQKCASYDIRLGYRAYEGYPSDQLRADLRFSFCPCPKVVLSASGHLEYGLFTGNSRTDESLFLFNPNYRLLRAQVEAEYRIFRCAALFAGYRQHLWGRNVGTSGGAYGGMRFQF